MRDAARDSPWPDWRPILRVQQIEAAHVKETLQPLTGKRARGGELPPPFVHNIRQGGRLPLGQRCDGGIAYSARQNVHARIIEKLE
jgi:hypothetical protein